MKAVLVFTAAVLTLSAQAGEKKTINLGLVPASQQPKTVPVSNTQDPSQGRNPNDPKDPNVRILPAGGAQDLLMVTRPLDNGLEDAASEGNQRQNVINQQLQNQLPNGLSNTPSRGSTPLNAIGR